MHCQRKKISRYIKDDLEILMKKLLKILMKNPMKKLLTLNESKLNITTVLFFREGKLYVYFFNKCIKRLQKQRKFS